VRLSRVSCGVLGLGSARSIEPLAGSSPGGRLRRMESFVVLAWSCFFATVFFESRILGFDLVVFAVSKVLVNDNATGSRFPWSSRFSEER
jgi:hypothetical protein